MSTSLDGKAHKAHKAPSDGLPGPSRPCSRHLSCGHGKELREAKSLHNPRHFTATIRAPSPCPAPRSPMNPRPLRHRCGLAPPRIRSPYASVHSLTQSGWSPNRPPTWGVSASLVRAFHGSETQDDRLLGIPPRPHEMQSTGGRVGQQPDRQAMHSTPANPVSAAAPITAGQRACGGNVVARQSCKTTVEPLHRRG